MSRIGKKPVLLPAGVQASIDKASVTVKGPKGELKREFSPYVTIKMQKKPDHSELVVTIEDDKHKALHGLSRSLLNNMVIGVSQGFKKELTLKGVGYRAQVKGSDIHFTLGFSHPVVHPLLKGISCKVEKNVELCISGIDKELVGQVCADIIKYRPVEPYHGKGIRYKDQRVSLKAGKSAKK